MGYDFDERHSGKPNTCWVSSLSHSVFTYTYSSSSKNTLPINTLFNVIRSTINLALISRNSVRHFVALNITPPL